MNKKKKDDYKKFLLYLIGGVTLLIGITLTLNWWNDILILFRGTLGILLSLSGMFALYIASKK